MLIPCFRHKAGGILVCKGVLRLLLCPSGPFGRITSLILNIPLLAMADNTDENTGMETDENRDKDYGDTSAEDTDKGADSSAARQDDTN